jgi:hypothetical protein
MGSWMILAGRTFLVSRCRPVLRKRRKTAAATGTPLVGSAAGGHHRPGEADPRGGLRRAYAGCAVERAEERPAEEGRPVHAPFVRARGAIISKRRARRRRHHGARMPRRQARHRTCPAAPAILTGSSCHAAPRALVLRTGRPPMLRWRRGGPGPGASPAGSRPGVHAHPRRSIETKQARGEGEGRTLRRRAGPSGRCNPHRPWQAGHHPPIAGRPPLSFIRHRATGPVARDPLSPPAHRRRVSGADATRAAGAGRHPGCMGTPRAGFVLPVGPPHVRPRTSRS